MSTSLPPILDALRVASPCPADWAQMAGDDASRHCGLCRKQVHDLTAMSEADVARLVERARDGDQVCVRLFRRADGKVMSSDCTYTRSGRRTWFALAAGLVAGLLALVGMAHEQSRGRHGHGGQPSPWWDPTPPWDEGHVMGMMIPTPAPLPVPAPAPQDARETDTGTAGGGDGDAPERPR